MNCIENYFRFDNSFVGIVSTIKTDKPKTSSFTLLDIKNPSVNGPKKGFGAKQK